MAATFRPSASAKGWGETSEKKLFEAIDARRRIALERFINAIGIRHVGGTTARLLARAYQSWPRFRKAMEAATKGGEAFEELDSIGGIGAVVAQAIADFFAEKHNREALDASSRSSRSRTRRLSPKARSCRARRSSSRARSRR